MAAWLVVVAFFFGLPLLAFSRPLRWLKEVTLLGASSVATRRERAAEREPLGCNVSAAGDAEAIVPASPGCFQVSCGGQEALDLADRALGARAGRRGRAVAAGRRGRHPATAQGAPQGRKEFVAAMSRTERRRSKLESAARIGSVVAALAVVMPDPVAAGAPTTGRALSAAKRRPRRLQRHCPRRLLRAERLRLVRHGR